MFLHCVFSFVFKDVSSVFRIDWCQLAKKKRLVWRKGFVKELFRSTLKKRLYLEEDLLGIKRGCFTSKKRFVSLMCILNRRFVLQACSLKKHLLSPKCCRCRKRLCFEEERLLWRRRLFFKGIGPTLQKEVLLRGNHHLTEQTLL